MEFKAAVRGVREGQRRVLRLQRRLWFAELALWPTAIVLVVLTAMAAWAWWRARRRRTHHAEHTAAPVAPPVDAPEPAVAAPAPAP